MKNLKFINLVATTSLIISTFSVPVLANNQNSTSFFSSFKTSSSTNGSTSSANTSASNINSNTNTSTHSTITKSANTSSSTSQLIENTRVAFENELLQLINQERTSAGLKAVTMDESLRTAARFGAEAMQVLDTDSYSKLNTLNLLKKFNISNSIWGKSYCWNKYTPQQAFNGLVNNADCFSCLLNTNYTKVGIGYNAEGGFWMQLFTN